MKQGAELAEELLTSIKIAQGVYGQLHPVKFSEQRSLLAKTIREMRNVYAAILKGPKTADT